MQVKDLEYYLGLPYTIRMIREDEETWFAEVMELPGCITEGDSATDAADMIIDAMKAWIGVSLEEGLPIPEPRGDMQYSGKFLVRVPRSLHRRLAEAAEQEGVSLNQYVNVLLAQGVADAPAGGPPAHSRASYVAGSAEVHEPPAEYGGRPAEE